MTMWEQLTIEEWTPGARRVVERSAQLAAWFSAPAVDPLHVLAALVQDEGRAAARLGAVGVDADSLAGELAWSWPEDWTPLPTISPWEGTASQLLHEAQEIAQRWTGGREVATEHLLWGLLQVTSKANELLQSRGFSVTHFPEAAPVVAPFPITESEPATPFPAELDWSLSEPAPLPTAQILRLLDAAANRVREALRVLEDCARFIWNDETLSRGLKELRHDFTASLSAFPTLQLLAMRDTSGDVGTRISTSAEYLRTGLHDVLAAACKRGQEALRSLEEYGKLFDGAAGQKFEALRYRLYHWEKVILRLHAARERLADQSVYLLLTESACPLGSGRVVHAAMDAGVRMIQVREKSLSDRELVAHCRNVRKWTQKGDTLLIINDRPDIAVMVEADGVHLGQDDCTVADARRLLGPDRIIGVSCHSMEHVRQAIHDGADYLGIGPTFPSQTKTFEHFPGLELIRAVGRGTAIPWFAIGGIHAGNLEAVIQAGGRRVAVSTAICRAPDPGNAAANLRAQFVSAPRLAE